MLNKSNKIVHLKHSKVQININGENFSQSTISSGIREGRILSKIEEIEIAYQQISDELNSELQVNIMINPCVSTNGVRKYKK